MRSGGKGVVNSISLKEGEENSKNKPDWSSDTARPWW